MHIETSPRVLNQRASGVESRSRMPLHLARGVPTYNRDRRLPVEELPVTGPVGHYLRKFVSPTTGPPPSSVMVPGCHCRATSMSAAAEAVRAFESSTGSGDLDTAVCTDAGRRPDKHPSEPESL